MKKYFLITLLLFTYVENQAQYLAAFNDNLGQFWAFEAGIFNKLEDSEVMDFQIGGNLIAYLDHVNNFKIYQYGKVESLMEVAQVEFTATDYLLGYSLFDTLFVYVNEQVKKLSTDCEKYIVRDSLIAWKTRSNKTLMVYYNGQITTISEDISDLILDPKMVGDNLFAFINSSTKEFNIFYSGKVITLDSYADEMIYQAGCDILAYMDIPDQSFNVFYKGEIIELDKYKPLSLQVGDQILAYVDNQKDLRFFENGHVKNITYEPEFYEVKDHVLVFEDQGSFKTVCNGQIYIVEQFIPQPYYIQTNTLAYLEHNDYVRVFQHCNRITANNVKVVKFDMVRDIIVFAEEEDELKVYFNGQVYEHKPY